MSERAGLLKLADEIRSVGFTCLQCGSCCRAGCTDSGIVMVMPAEIRTIISVTGGEWSGIAEPFPERIPLAGSGSYTFGWCLKRRDGACIFLDKDRCSVYAQRPWICRTFPFMLDGDELRISDCPGIGQEIYEEAAVEIASDLLRRKEIEGIQEREIHSLISHASLDPDTDVVIDNEGVKNLSGRPCDP